MYGISALFWRARGSVFGGAAILLGSLLVNSCSTTHQDARSDRYSIANPPASASSIDFAALGGTDAQYAVPLRQSAIAAPLQTVDVPSNSPAQLEEAEIYRPSRQTPGTGVTSATNQAIANGDDVTLNFSNTDVHQVIDLVLGETLGLSYTIDPKVSGTITTRTARPLPRSAVLDTLESVLAANNIAIVQRAGVYNVVPLDQAGAGIPAARMSGTGAGFGLHILPMRYVSATEVASLMQPYVPPGRTLQVLPGQNVLLFAGTGTEARELQDLADTFDVDWLRGKTFALLPVTYANADNIADELEKVFGAEPNGPLAGLVSFLPIARLNAVLAMSNEESYINEAKTWVERLDRSAAGAGRSTYVYHVQNARAGDLARVLQSLYGGGNKQEAAPVNPLDRPSVFSQPATSEGLTAATGNTVDPAGTSGFQQAQIASFETSNGVRIVADDSQNSLLISCNREQYQEIQSVLRQLDTVPLQVLIEATIAEVTLNDQLRFGLQWFFRSGQGSSTLSQADDGSVGGIFPGFSYVLDSKNANVVLDALSKITKVRVISSPSLLVLDNQRATLQVGDQVPVATRSSVSTDTANAPIVNQIEFRDTGVLLEVVPRVNSSGLVLLDISQEVSDVVPTTSSNLDLPTVRQRRLASAIVVNSGETVALGGLIRDGTTRDDVGVPFLSEIPILGHAFKSTGDTRDRTELLVLITPRISRDSAETRVLTDELRNRLSSLRPLEQRLNQPAAEQTGVLGRLRAPTD